jgi:hypothetical protein
MNEVTETARQISGGNSRWLNEVEYTCDFDELLKLPDLN